MPQQSENEGTVVRTLMGARNLDFSIKCLRSLVTRSEIPLKLTVHSDGSLGLREKEQLREGVASNVAVVDREEADDCVAPHLANYPLIRAYRGRDVMFKKLIDVVLMEPGPRMRYCDSDILFFRQYGGLFGALGENEALFMRDVRTCYAFGWNIEARKFFPIPERLNAGLIDYPVRSFDLDLVEYILKSETFSNKLWEEQTIWAILASRLQANYPEEMIVPDLKSDPHRSFAWHLVTPMRSVWPLDQLVAQAADPQDSVYQVRRRAFRPNSYPMYIGIRTAGGLRRRARNLQERLIGASARRPQGAG